MIMHDGLQMDLDFNYGPCYQLCGPFNPSTFPMVSHWGPCSPELVLPTHMRALLTLIAFFLTPGPKSSGGNWDQTIDQIVDDIAPRPSAACFALQNEGGSV